MKKRNFVVITAVLLLLGAVAGESAKAEEAKQACPEEQAYQEFLDSGEYLSDVKNLSDLSYGISDINQDGQMELILKGMEEGSYEYCFYRYKNDQVKAVGSFQNWQNGGNGEMYYAEAENSIVVNTRLADHQSYTLYQVSGKIKKGDTLHKQSLDEKTADGTFQRTYAYTREAADGTEETIEEQVWNMLEEELVEIPFSELNVSGSREYSEEQVAALGKSLGVPEDIKITGCYVSEPWYWEGAGRWLVNIELYSNDLLLAGAAIDPDTLELEREISPYDAGRVEKEKQEAALAQINSSDMEVANGLIQILISGDGSAFLRLLPTLPAEYQDALGAKMVQVFTEVVRRTMDEAIQEFQKEYQEGEISYQAVDSEDVDSETLAELQKEYGEFGYQVTAARIVREALTEESGTGYMEIPVVQIDGKWYLDLESWDSDEDEEDDYDEDSDEDYDAEDFDEEQDTASSAGDFDGDSDGESGYSDSDGENQPDDSTDFPEEAIEHQPFYGVWCYASKDFEEAVEFSETLEAVCEEPQVVLTSSWSNLSCKPYYAVTAGKYETEEDANEKLEFIKSTYGDAYVKYSGEFCGEN